MRHPDNQNKLVKYHNILQAWEYLSECVELSDVLETIEDDELIDAYISRFGQVLPKEVSNGK